MTFEEITGKYGISGKVSPIGNGHINDTFVSEDGRYIIQRINTEVFKDPAGLMENIVGVTEYLREKIRAAGGDPERETLTVIRTLDGQSFVPAENGAYRAYLYVGGTKTVECGNKTPADMYGAGVGFGRFQRMLADYPVETLHETIPFFHDTPVRIEQLKTAIKEDKAGRVSSVSEEIAFALAMADDMDKAVKGLKDGSIPNAVTHNDTKINNILFDEATNEPLCVIDLDTVMPGSRLYDYGDALRAGASTADEDETDLSKVGFDAEAFRMFTKGYLSEMGGCLSPREIELLPYSIRLMTYECGTRFLADYLNGDTYFKVSHPTHNLERAHTQFKLAAELKEREDELLDIVREMLGC